MTTDQDRAVDRDLKGTFHPWEVYQAQGMVMASLGVDLAEAMVRLHECASSSGLSLSDVSRCVVDGAIEIH